MTEEFMWTSRSQLQNCTSGIEAEGKNAHKNKDNDEKEIKQEEKVDFVVLFSFNFCIKGFEIAFSHIAHPKESHAHRKENRDHQKGNRDRLEGNAHRREMETMNVGEETNHKNAGDLLSAEESEVQKGKDEKGRGRATMIYRRNFAETEALRSPGDVPEAESDHLEEMSAREAENEHGRSKGGTDQTAETSEEEAEDGDPAVQKSGHVVETNRVRQAGKSTGNRVLWLYLLPLSHVSVLVSVLFINTDLMLCFYLCYSWYRSHERVPG
ncbi:hypothetical protein OESDEN_11015 [Oesophagostomum dentatum]|uniref:Transmembrane protein n=1 Tax=Oesophagostomum dentatum TaxID=61180 RepID=A0A0B1SW53_OESDE|nr:hypothetical protein OESDEN_11015 [Oesophagostomum dentatum]